MQIIQLKSIVPAKLTGHRLDQTLGHLFSQFSRTQLQQWIKQGKVWVNGEPKTRPRDKVVDGQAVEITTELEDKHDWQPQSLPLNIIYEDPDILIINKPSGLVVHPGAGNSDQTLVNALLYYAKTLAKLPRAGLIHRLDKDTSGLLIVARTLPVYHTLIQAMQQRRIVREYQAIVQGVTIAGGTITTQIGRHPRQRTKMSVVTNGKPATTHYRVLERFHAHTYLEIKLDTGRTHQIRVHLTHIHYPIVGDPLYGKTVISQKLSAPLQQQLSNFTRQALHAFRLSFQHPTTHQLMSYEAPLPDDMQKLLDELRKDKMQQ